MKVIHLSDLRAYIREQRSRYRDRARVIRIDKNDARRRKDFTEVADLERIEKFQGACLAELKRLELAIKGMTK